MSIEQRSHSFPEQPRQEGNWQPTKRAQARPRPSLLRAAKGLFVMIVSSAMMVAIAILPVPAATADTAPVDPASPATPVTVSADALPTAQIDGVAWQQLVVGNTVYVVGKFSTARPAGSAPGTNTVPRNNILAYDIRTGALITSFAPSLNAQALSVAASPDGSRIYVGGDFTAVNGTTVWRVAALNAVTGQLITSFLPKVASSVRAIVATSSAVYMGGLFGAVGQASRQNLAAASPTDGALLPWHPVAGGKVNALVLSPDKTQVVIGGAFTTLNGSSNPGYGLGSVDSTIGALLPFGANNLIRDGGPQAAILSLSSDSTNVYGSGYVFGTGGNLEGVFSANWSDGAIKWVDDCHGDTYGVYAAASAVYAVGHSHYCGNIGGFPQTTPWGFHRGLAFGKDATGTITDDPYGYYNFAGNPSPSLLNWFPDLDTGTVTGQNQGPWAVTGNSQYVVMGGEFKNVNSSAQQGLVRFAVKEIAPNKEGPRVTGAKLNPSVISTAAGTARLSWQADWDRDNEHLTYQVIRDNKTAAPIYTTTQESTFWSRPGMGYIDSGLVPGSTHTYRVFASDPFGNIAKSDGVSITVAASGAVSNYTTKVLNDGALDFWRLDQASGSSVVDWAGWNDLAPGTGISGGAGGAILGDSDKASTFDGTSAGFASTRTPVPGPDTFTVESWINTTSTSGGKILGFGSSATGDSGSYDRHVYMDNAGHIWFGVYPGGVQTLNSSGTYNDGQWHQIVASLGTTGMALYVDGKRVGHRSDVTSGQAYSGYWRVGGDNLGGWPNGPASNYFQGSIDDVSLYPSVLTLQQVQGHFTASGRTLDIPVAPADAYGKAVFDAGPDLYWRLGETNGSIAADSGVNGNSGTYVSGVTLGAPGAVAGTANTAASFDGSTGLLSSNAQFSNPTTYSEELWFNTTTTNGGKLIGFGNAATGLSSGYDRHVYMENDGRLTFGVWTGNPNTVTSPNGYNDGRWHHLVATQAADGMKLYVDGALVGTNPQTQAQAYDGYWRVGSDNTWGPQPYFSGLIDEVAIYPTELSADVVGNHHAIGSVGIAPNQPPAAAFTTSSADLVASFDGSSSSDPDGTVASYSWDFGDGSAAGAGVKPAHNYAAAGTYQVKLTVTDDKGATASVTNPVIVVQNQPPAAAFTTSSADLVASFDGSGASDPDGTVASYSWDFGDGSAAGAGGKPSHTYAAAGTYQVKLTVTDNKGATASVTNPAAIAAAGTVPRPDHVVVVVMENESAASIIGNPDAPYINSLASNGALMTQSFGVTHPSEPNYLALFSGATQGLTDDSCPNTYSATNLAGQLNAKQLSFVGYSESLPSVGFMGCTSGAYARKHSPWTNFPSLPAAVNQPLTAIPTDYTTLPTVSFVIPNLQNDMHDGTIAQADTWLQGNLGAYATWAGQHNSLLILTWDEGDATNQIATIFSGQRVRQGQYPDRTDHYNVLRTLQEAYGLGSNGNTVSATPITSIWASLNQPPAPAFTSSAVNLAASFDGSGSSDPDGTVASYGWDFGDGSTAGAGVRPAHNYAAAGTYQVKLTVTDNRGASASATHPVTVTAAGNQILAQDGFGRSVAAGWGSADRGGVWTLNGSASYFSVGNGLGSVTLTKPAAGPAAYLNGVSSSSAETSVKLSLNKVANGGGTLVSVVGRHVGTVGEYAAKVKVSATGGVTLEATKLINGATSSLVSKAVAGLTYTVADQLQVRVQVTGTTPTQIRAKVWKVGATEPAAWQISTTDAELALQAAGTTGLVTYVSSTALNTPVIVRFDEYAVTKLG